MSKEVTREEMLDLLFDIEQEWVHQILSLHERLATGQRLTKEERGRLRRLEWGVQKKQKILHAIRRHIEHGPGVSREFVDQLALRLETFKMPEGE